jgi:hypothetical protein
MPVDSHIESGVVVESSGERTASEGPQAPSMKPCFRWVIGWVQGGGLVDGYLGLRHFSPGEFAKGFERIGVVGEGLVDVETGQLFVGE